MMARTPSSPIVVALDVATRAEAIGIAERLNPAFCRVKVGKELFTAVGPQILDDLHRLGFAVFLDLKFHDIPTTVAKAVKVAADLGVWMVNVHTSGGGKMLAGAVEAIANYQQKPLLIGVTVLTSFSQADFIEIGGRGELSDHVVSLARLAFDSGLDGVVCSAFEVKRLKAETSPGFLAVTPGIRLLGADHQDQSRVMTPVAAVQQGSDYLVIGRAITHAPDPAAMCVQIAGDIANINTRAGQL